MTVPFVDLVSQHAEVAAEITEGFERVINEASFVGGREVAAFEAEFARYTSSRVAIGVGSGTDAIELALRGMGIGPGDEVVLPANSFIATAEAVARCGARPVLVDCDDEHLLIDVDQATAAITARTKAVVPVHLFGQLAPVEALAPAAEAQQAVVLEDAAQAHGALRFGQQAGAIGAAAAFSFYPSKNLGAYGDAGAVVTNDVALGRRVAALRNHGSEARYQHPILGFNSRLDTLQAVVLRANLRHLERWNMARRAAAERYTAMLSSIPGVRPPGVLRGNDHVWHLYVIRVDGRDGVIDRLRRAGVQTGIHYPVPIHLTGAFQDLGYGRGAFPVAERAAAEMISLPMHPYLSRADQDRVVEALASVFV